MLPEVTDFCRLILLRHPELSPRDAGTAVGAGPATLGRRGQQRILVWLELLQGFEIYAVVSSEQPQCADAAAAVAAAKGVDLATDARLRDQELGSWQGKSWEEIAAAEPDRVHEFFAEFGEVRAPEGESLGEAVERFIEWWSEHRVEFLGRTVVTVTSGAMATGFAAAMLGMRLSRAVSLNLPHGGVGVLDLFANGCRVATWNPDGLVPETDAG